MSLKYKVQVQVFTAKPHIKDPASLVLLMRYYREQIPLPHHRWLDTRNHILLKLHEANVPLTCQYCGREHLLPFAPRRHVRLLTIDHIVPRCCGGNDELTNLTISCERCNVHKGSASLEDPELASYRKPKTIMALLRMRIQELKDIVDTSTFYA